jgi:hypothetical protein
MLAKALLSASASLPPLNAGDVFSPFIYTGNGSTQTITNGINLSGDGGLVWIKSRSAATDHQLFDTVRGATNELISNSTANAAADADTLTAFNSNGFTLGADSNTNTSGATYVSWAFRQAATFFDVVPYTGTGADQTLSHSLAKQPGLIIIKNRDGAPAVTNWMVSARVLSGGDNSFRVVGRVNLTDAFLSNDSYFSSTPPTASNFFIRINAGNSGVNYIAYLFASHLGVSKVGSYTGTGTTLSIDCGFTAGARFVLIKRTDSTGDWYVWDTACGIVSGNDPYLLLNSADAEITNTDYIDPLSSGFQISSTAPAAINASGGTYLFLAIA